MDPEPQDCIEIHTSLTEELRHSDGIVWQFALAIIALEDGAVALSSVAGFQNQIGKSALSAGWMLSVCLGFMLVRHAYDRRNTVRRLLAVEDELRKTYPTIFSPANGSPQWRTPLCLAWVLLAETTVGFALFLWHLYA